MRLITLVTGGARSGKSRFAEQLALRISEHYSAPGYYIATAEAGDGEMAERIARHRERREQSMAGWQTIEEPYDLTGRLEEIAGTVSAEPVVLVDCLTLWLSNWLLCTEQDDPERRIEQQVSHLLAAAKELQGWLVIVTNEVGDGLVPEYPLGRLFRDLAGWMNQRMAEQADHVFLVTAGIPIELKRARYRFVAEDFCLR